MVPAAQDRSFEFSLVLQSPGTVQVDLRSTEQASAVVDIVAVVCSSGRQRRNNSAGRSLVLRVVDCFVDVCNTQHTGSVPICE